MPLFRPVAYVFPEMFEALAQEMENVGLSRGCILSDQKDG